MSCARRLAVASLWLWGALLCVSYAPAQAPRETRDTLEFRRVYVPIERLGELSSGHPVKRDEFEQLLATINAVPHGPRGASARVVSAEYSARLEQHELVGGLARLAVKCSTPEETLLPLEPCTLAIESPRWQTDDDDDTVARLGLDAAGKLAVVIEPVAAMGDEEPLPGTRTQELRFDWSLRGARDPSGTLIFDLQTPAAPATRLTLDLPAGRTPIVQNGLVSRVESTDAADAMDGARQTWLIELGGSTRTTLSIVSDEMLQERQKYVLLSQHAAYEVQPRSLEATFDLKLDIFHDALRQLDMRLDSSLQVTGVRVGDQPVAWTVTPAADGVGKQVIVEFPEPLTGTGRTLRVEALAPLKLDASHPLPMLRPLGVLWQEGTITLSVREGLELCDLAPQHCRQTKVSTTAAPRRAEVHQFQCVRQDCSLEMLVRTAPARLQSRSGLTLTWDGPHLAGRLIADITALQGEAYQVEADVPGGWVIDAVETEPTAMLDDWNFQFQPGRVQTLTLRMAKAISPEQPVRITVLGHRRAPQRNERLQPHEYRLGRLRGIDSQRRLVAVQTESQQLTLAGDAGLMRLDPRTLSETDRGLVDVQSSRLVFVDGSAGPRFTLGLHSEPPRFAAQSTTTVTIGRDRLTENYHLRCQPEGAPLSRLVVQFSPAREAQPVWHFGREMAPEISARRIDAQRGDDLETWELVLQRPVSKPLEFSLQRVTPFTDQREQSVALLTLPEADTHSGTILVEAADGMLPTVDQQGLKPILPATAAPQAVSATRARFHYQPAPDQRLVVGLPPTGGAAAPLWAWEQILTARIDGVANITCTACYRLENTGVADLKFQLPETAKLWQVRIDGQRTTAAASRQQQVIVPLPAESRFVTLAVDYTLPMPRPTLFEELPLAAPALDIPILTSRAEVWLAPELRLSQSTDRTDELSWRQRLAGPLARPTNAPAPALFSLAAWRREWTGTTVDDNLREQARAYLQAWDQLRTTVDSDEQPLTWGTWIERYDRLARDNAGMLPALRLRSAELAALGIDPDTPIADPSAPATDCFRRAGVVLLLDQQTVVLAARKRVDEHSTEPILPTTVLLASKPIDAIPAAAWLAKPSLPRSPWRIAPAATDDLASAGWRAITWTMDDPQRTTCVVVRWREVQAIAWGLFLAAGALSYWTLARRVRLLLLVVTACALAALLLPLPMAPLATAIFLGTAIGALARYLVPQTRPRPASQPERSERRSGRLSLASTASAAAPVLLLGLIGWFQTALAQQKAPETPVQEAYQVLIPVDADQKPTGDIVYLPRPFYDALHRQARLAKAVPQGWMIYDATYRGRLQWESLGDTLQFAELDATFDLEVFQANTEVVIQLGRENLHLLDDYASLDNEPVAIEWLESGEGFRLAVEKPGRYRLAVRLQPTTRSIGELEQVDVRIPRLARSQLILKGPADADDVQIPRALGRVVATVPGEWHVHLGPTGRLAVQWPSGETTMAATSDVEVAQLVWWKIRPSAVTAEAVWKFRSGGAPLREVRLIADPRLRLLPLAADQPIAEQSSRSGDDVQSIHFILKEPHEREVTLRTSFSLEGVSGVGDLILPRLEAVADRTTRHWLGVSTSSTLAASLDSQVAAEPVSAQEFVNTWGEGEPPSIALRAPAQRSPVILHVQPRPPEVSARQALTYVFGHDETTLELEALATVAQAPVFQYRMRLPAGFEPLGATLTQEESERPVRVARSGENTVTLMLPAAAQGEHRLVVKARSRSLRRGMWSPGDVGLVGAQVQPPVVFLERTPHVELSIKASEGYEPVSDAPPPPPAAVTRREAVLRPQPGVEQRRLELEVAPNPMRMHARQIISVTRQGDAWQAIVDVECHVQEGSVPALRWESASEITTTPKTDSDATAQVVPLPGQSRQHLILRFSEPRSGTFRTRVTLPLIATSGERLQVPELRLLDAEPVETLVILPTQVEDQQIAWETRGLQAVELPANRQDLASPGSLVLAPVAGRYQAAVRRIERAAGVPQVRLADVRVQLVSSGRYYGVASFALEPAGLTDCRVQLPEGAKLRQALVGNTPAVIQREDERTWRLQLHHDQLPQQIEVLFQGTLPESETEELTLQAPVLEGLPVERTLWTVAPPSDEMKLSLREGEMDRARHTLYRVRAAAVLLEHAASMATDSDVEQATTWFRQWMERAAKSHAELMREEAADDQRSESLRAESQALAQQAQQWGVAGLTATAFDESPVARTFADLASATLPDDGVLRTMLPGSAEELRVGYQPQEDAGRTPLLVAAVVLIVGVVLVLVSGSSQLREWLAAHPQAVGVAVGIAWWFLLTPGIVGLLISVLFAAAALRSPWPRSGELSSSTFRSSSAARRWGR